MAHSYISLEEMRNTLNFRSNSTADNKKIIQIIQASSEWIDRATYRTFRTYLGRRVFTPSSRNHIYIPDVISLSSVKTDLDMDGTFEEVWTATDYVLGDPNAQLDEKPYTWIKASETGNEYFPDLPMSLELTGTWGYWRDLDEGVTTLGAAIVSTTAKSVTIANANAIETCQTIEIGSEQMYVRAINSAGLILTVDRGVNGTTAATHSNGASVGVHRYPSDIVAAASFQAARVWRRLEVPTGVVNTPGDIGWRSVYVPKFDSDILAFIQPYKRLGRSIA